MGGLAKKPIKFAKKHPWEAAGIAAALATGGAGLAGMGPMAGLLGGEAAAAGAGAAGAGIGGGTAASAFAPTAGQIAVESAFGGASPLTPFVTEAPASLIGAGGLPGGSEAIFGSTIGDLPFMTAGAEGIPELTADAGGRAGLLSKMQGSFANGSAQKTLGNMGKASLAMSLLNPAPQGGGGMAPPPPAPPVANTVVNPNAMRGLGSSEDERVKRILAMMMRQQQGAA